MAVQLLPEDFHNHWFSNIMFPLLNPFSVEKCISQIADRPQLIRIFRCTCKQSSIKRGKEIKELCYNQITRNYEFDGRRFVSYANALSAAEIAMKNK